MARQLPAVLKNGLILWLDSAGKDLSGNGNNGTLVNTPTKVRRLQNDGLSYNGSTQYINIPDNASLQFGTGDFSVNVWVYMPTLPGNLVQYTFVSKNYTGFEMLIYNNGTTRYMGSYVGGVANAIGSTATTFQANTWYMLTLVRNGSTITQYINTVADGTTTNSANASNIGTAVNIGRRASAGTLYANGNLLNPMIWNRALSTKEVELLHKCTFIK